MKKIGSFGSLMKKRTEGSSDTSIRKRITSAITAIIITLSLVLGALSAYLTYASTLEALEVSMKETAKLASKEISVQLQSYRDIAHEIGSIAKMSSPDISKEEKQRIFQGFDKWRYLCFGTTHKQGDWKADNHNLSASLEERNFRRRNRRSHLPCSG